MINSQGGSSHDPETRLPPAMWERPVRQSPTACRACAGRSAPVDSPMFEVPRATFSEQDAADLAKLELGPLALVCRRCDSSGV